jgi:hypothetical protein
MRPTRKQLIGALITLGAFFLFLAYYQAQNHQDSIQGTRLATVKRETGQIILYKSGLTKKIKVEETTDVQNLDSVESNDIGQATVTFEGGSAVKLLPNSLVTIERIDEPDNITATLIVQRGDVQVTQKGRHQTLFIAKNGERLAAEAYNNSELQKKVVEEDSPEEAAGEKNTLSQEEITASIQQYRNNFFKCFTQLMQKNPTAKGEATLTFTIENNGHPSQADISTRLGDEVFRSCLTSVVKRIQFRPFRGPPISTIFPLRFE